MKKFFAFVAGVLGLGLVAKFVTRKAEGAPGGIAATPAKPQVEKIPIAPPPEPAGGWEAHMTAGVTQQAIADCRTAGDATNEDELRICVMNKIFPGLNWKTRLGWQLLAWNEAGTHVFTAAEVESWPFYAASPRGREIAVKFWLLAHRVVRECAKTNFTLEQIQTCAARAMFPEDRWPPEADAQATLRAVWDRLAGVIAQQSQ